MYWICFNGAQLFYYSSLYHKTCFHFLKFSHGLRFSWVSIKGIIAFSSATFCYMKSRWCRQQHWMHAKRIEFTSCWDCECNPSLRHGRYGLFRGTKMTECNSNWDLMLAFPRWWDTYLSNYLSHFRQHWRLTVVILFPMSLSDLKCICPSHLISRWWNNACTF